MSETRSPICTVVGHIDHGKSSILDKIRGSAITKTEAGKITQAIGASIIPLGTIKKIVGDLLEKLKLSLLSLDYCLLTLLATQLSQT